MRPSLRFLGLAVVGWAGFRAATLGMLPGAELFRVQPSEAKVPPIRPTQFPAVDPIEPAQPLLPADSAALAAPPMAAVANGPAVRYVQAEVGVPVAMRPGVVTVYQLPAPSASAEPAPRPAPRFGGATYTAADYSVYPMLDIAALSRVGSFAGPTSHPVTVVPAQSVPEVDPRKIDRWQLSAWALLRAQQSGVAGSRSLAPAGQLGASQAGTRLLYNVNRLLALSGRVSSEVGRRGGEVAAGVRVHPLISIPVWFTAERRQAIGRYGGGRNAFAFFAEGGVYERPLPWRFMLDGYFEAGLVGLKSRDLFFDGGLTATRPLFHNFSGGIGVWGGAQPRLSRVDVGPRLTMRVRKNVKVHLDWRQKVAGNARPGSGPALTLAGDF